MTQSSPTASLAAGASSPRICASPPRTAPWCSTHRAPSFVWPSTLTCAINRTPSPSTAWRLTTQKGPISTSAPRRAPSSTSAVGWTVIVAVEDHGAELGLGAELVADIGSAFEAPHRPAIAQRLYREAQHVAGAH